MVVRARSGGELTAVWEVMVHLVHFRVAPPGEPVGLAPPRGLLELLSVPDIWDQPLLLLSCACRR